MLPGTRAHGGSSGRRKKTRQKYFFQAGNSGIYQRFPFRLQKDISTRQLAAEVFEHASICSPAWELEFISTSAQFLSTLRCVRLHRKPSTVSFDFRLQWERKRIIGSLGQPWNALTSAPGAKNELLNGGLSSRFFFFFFFFFFPSFVYQVKT